MQLAGQFERRAETRSGCELCHAYVVWCSDTRVVMRDGLLFYHYKQNELRVYMGPGRVRHL